MASRPTRRRGNHPGVGGRSDGRAVWHPGRSSRGSRPRRPRGAWRVHAWHSRTRVGKRRGEMNSCVFLGPTMPVSDARAILDASYLPPAGCGDVYRAVMDGATTIAIVDGFFHLRPAVRHKEIAWALSRGVRVFGAASMGALRAVEMAASGMRGVGRIFEAFCRGDLEDD